jgi:predicted CoA-binding protein
MKAQGLIAEFLKGRRIAVASVSRKGDSAANAIFRKLRDARYEVFPVNPNAF